MSGGDRPASDPAHDRARSVVVGVLAEALRARDAGGILVGGPEGPEARLVTGWCEHAGLPVREPDAGRVAEVRAVLGAGPAAHACARDAVARAEAVDSGWLVAAPWTKTHWLVDGPPAEVVPLGDLWLSTVRVWAGGHTPLGRWPDLGPGEIEALDRALARFLEEGWPVTRALEGLDEEGRRRCLAVLQRARTRGRAPLIPKLTRWTAGHDLAL